MAHDLFVSYHSRDQKAVGTVRDHLIARGIRAFVDREHLVAGLPWPQAIERALKTTTAVAVFLGPHGLGHWQKREMGFALDRQVYEEQAGRTFPVIPVLLPGADPSLGAGHAVDDLVADSQGRLTQEAIAEAACLAAKALTRQSTAQVGAA